MPFFQPSEFRCPCPDHGCVGKTVIGPHPLLLERLETLRATLGVAIQVNSGVRCPAHNKEIGGAPHSQHLQGHAADITCDPRYIDDLKERADKLFAEGGMGSARFWAHVDIGPKRRWTYPH